MKEYPTNHRIIKIKNNDSIMKKINSSLIDITPFILRSKEILFFEI